MPRVPKTPGQVRHELVGPSHTNVKDWIQYHARRLADISIEGGPLQYIEFVDDDQIVVIGHGEDVVQKLKELLHNNA